MEQNKMDGLPEGWEIEKLSNVWEAIRWVSYKKEQLLSGPDGAVSLMRANNIGDQVDLAELQYVPFDAVKPQQLIRDWDSLICMSSGSHHLVGKSVMLRGLENFTFGAFCGVFRPSGERLLPGYVSHYLRSENVRGKLASLWNGAWISNIKPSDIENLEIPLPPIPKQERIVTKLDGIFEHIDASIKLLEQNIANADAMAESSLDEAFFFSKDWDDGHLIKLWDIGNYQNGKAFKPNEWSSSWLPIIRIQNLNWINSNYNYCNFEVADKFIIHDGDLLFAWSWTPWTSFGAHIWNGWKAVLNQHIFRIDFDRNSINTRYFQLALNQTVLHFINQSHGSSWLAHIKKGEFEKSKIPLPPLLEQERIVAKLDAFFAEQKAIKSGYGAKISELKALKSSILSSAFRGEI